MPSFLTKKLIRNFGMHFYYSASKASKLKTFDFYANDSLYLRGTGFVKVNVFFMC